MKQTGKLLVATVVMVMAAGSVGIGLGYQSGGQEVRMNTQQQNADQELSQGWVD